MSLGKLEILSLFKSNMLEFLDNIATLCPEEQEIIVFRILFENQLPVEDILIKFSRAVIPVKEMIVNKNERFFLDGTNIFGNVKDEKLIKWKRLWTNRNLDKADKEAIWKWLQLFLGLAEMFINNEKKVGNEIL